MAFDDTYTDQEFKRRLQESNRDWIAQVARREPDLAVDGLGNSLFSRLLGLLTGRNRR